MGIISYSKRLQIMTVVEFFNFTAVLFAYVQLLLQNITEAETL